MNLSKTVEKSGRLDENVSSFQKHARMRQNPSRLPSGARKDGAQFESPSSPNSSPQFEPLTGNLSQSMLLKALT